MILVLLSAWAAFAEPGNGRFALVAGANDGGRDRVRLRYAVSDAEAMGTVLTQLGGVPEEQLMVLREPTRGALHDALTALAAQVRAASGPTSAIVYYSGHSDRTGLLLGTERYPYEALQRDLDALGATIEVAIVDGCASGSMIRAKGGTSAPAFLPLGGSAVEGRATLTSSSADEVSQEADHIGSSYFTHALLTGLRGAADFDDDHEVTLREAYQFAADETLARTERTRLGGQHPSYDIQLSGIGDFVLTDVRGPGTRAVLDKALRGRVYLRDANGHLAIELQKAAGREVALVLPPGRYSVVVDDQGALLEGVLRLGGGADGRLRALDLDVVTGEVTLARGRIYARVPAAIAFAPYPTSEGLNARDQLHHFSLGIVAVYAARLRGLGIGSVATTYRDGASGVQIAGAYNHVAGRLNGVQLSLGGNVGKEVRGLQLAPINVASTLRGVQLGAVNVASRHHGVSLSVVHISKSAKGLPIALLPIVGDGIHEVQLAAGTDAVELGFRLGARSFHTVYGVAWTTRGLGLGRIGFGVRARPGRWEVDTDVLLGAGGAADATVIAPALRLTGARPLGRFAWFVSGAVAVETLLETFSEPVTGGPRIQVGQRSAVVPSVALGARL